MIIDALFRWFAQALSLVTGALPQPPEIQTGSWWSGASSAFQWIVWANAYVPLDQAAAAVALLLTGWAIFYGIDLVEWVLTKLHILGGNSR